MYTASHEANVSAKEKKALPHTRVPPPHQNRYWPSHAAPPSPKRPSSPFGIKMPKKHRLTHADFSEFKRPRRESGGYFIVSYTERLGSKPKFACVVSKKISPKATERNTIRRRVMAVLRDISASMPGGIYVFTAKKDVKLANFQDILEDLTKIVSKIKK